MRQVRAWLQHCCLCHAITACALSMGTVLSVKTIGTSVDRCKWRICVSDLHIFVTLESYSELYFRSRTLSVLGRRRLATANVQIARQNSFASNTISIRRAVTKMLAPKAQPLGLEWRIPYLTCSVCSPCKIWLLYVIPCERIYVGYQNWGLVPRPLGMESVADPIETHVRPHPA